MNEKERAELVVYRLNKGKSTLLAANNASASKDWNTVVNRLYYSCFYAVTALLASREIYTRTHSGVMRMLGLNFVKSGEISSELNDFYLTIFGMRQSGDYEDFCDYEEEDVVELLEPASEFINTIESILYRK